MRERFSKLLVFPFANLGALGLLLLGMIVTLEVVLRAFGISVAGGVELSEILLAMLVFAGLAYTQATDGHVTMEAIVNLTPPAYRRATNVLSLAICSATAALMTWGTTQQAIQSYVRKEFQFGTTHFPLWPTKAVVAFGLALLTVEFVFQVVAATRALRQPRTED